MAPLALAEYVGKAVFIDAKPFRRGFVGHPAERIFAEAGCRFGMTPADVAMIARKPHFRTILPGVRAEAVCPEKGPLLVERNRMPDMRDIRIGARIG